MKHLLVVAIDSDKHKDVAFTLPPGSTILFSETTPAECVGEYTFKFNKDSPNFHGGDNTEYNWLFLRTQQNWANDMLRARGYMFLNDVLHILGLPIRASGQIVGWVWDKNVETKTAFISFGCWDDDHAEDEATGEIELKFNVQGPIYTQIEG